MEELKTNVDDLESSMCSRPATRLLLGPASVALYFAVSTRRPAEAYFVKDEAGNVDRLAKWEVNWRNNSLGWARKEPYPSLVKHQALFMNGGGSGNSSQGGAAPSHHRVFVPLCGKTPDLAWLADQKHQVVGVEGIEKAVYELQKESWLSLQKSHVPYPRDDHGAEFIPAAKWEGAKRGYMFTTGEKGLGYYTDPYGRDTMAVFADAKKPLTVVCADFFRLTPAIVGEFSRIWDRASLVAVPPEAQEAYVDICDNVLLKGGKILLVTLEYDQSKVNGPPFSINEKQVKALYEPRGYNVQLLEREQLGKTEYKGGKWAALEGEVHECVFMLTKTRSGGKRKTWLQWLLRRK